jgi:hypothetical protein
MVDVGQPMAGADRHVPRPGTYGTAVFAGLSGHTRSLHAPRIHARAAATATVLAGRTCSFSRLDILEWRRLGPAIARELLQHHGAPTTSYWVADSGASHHTTPSTGNIFKP